MLISSSNSLRAILNADNETDECLAEDEPENTGSAEPKAHQIHVHIDATKASEVRNIDEEELEDDEKEELDRESQANSLDWIKVLEARPAGIEHVEDLQVGKGLEQDEEKLAFVCQIFQLSSIIIGFVGVKPVLIDKEIGIMMPIIL